MRRIQIKQRFPTLMCDFPWPHTGGGGRAASCHYEVQPIDAAPGIITSSPIWRPSDNAHLYFWAINSFLEEAFWVIKKLEFRYITCLTWTKPRVGIGMYFRGQTEHLLFAVKGRGIDLRRRHTNRKDFSTHLPADFMRDWSGSVIHSAKPDEAYELVEAASPGPYADLFSRRSRENWWAWGYDAPTKENRP